MKTIAMILLGLILSVPVEASKLTVHDLHLGCEALARMGDLLNYQAMLADAIPGADTHGYIVGSAEATPGLHLPTMQDEVVDAVCKYIDLHPGMWTLPANTGLQVVFADLYYVKPKKGTK